MKRTILTAAQFAALAKRPPVTVWNQQPRQQQFEGGDGAGDGDGGDDGSDGDDGSGSGDGSDAGDKDGGDGSDAGDGDDGGDDKKLGPAGEKALNAIKAKEKDQRTKRIAAEKENRELKAKLAEKDSGKPGGDEEQRKRESEITARANAKIVRSEVRAAAAGLLADPADAPRFLDLEQFEVGEDGDVDSSAIEDAIKELIEDKPYLAAQGGKKKPPPKPDGRQGGGGGRRMSGSDLGKAEAAKRFGNRDKK
ncbi:hypothetical protein [Rhodococcus sp. 14-2470-1a]|uniref:hypothetical protein n=1 Tax=Rhodococcus sp. 14-2470-1a TaxID=2023150 RepID=UPI000B9B2EF9|nr:hypothetical protein [Rhodococcus sp. 14-2470-1a]OZF47562.1 hypothetical protein CH292_19250 [Rhodococcus sp. 14-2470-1a]